MRIKDSQTPLLILGAVLPLVYALKSLTAAVILASSVLCAVTVFEILFVLVKSFWYRSLRLALAFLILSAVVTAIWIVMPYFGFQTAASYLPVSILSALFLIQPSLREANSFLLRVKIWAGFLIAALVIGVLAEKSVSILSPAFEHILSGFSLVCAQILFYEVSMKQALKHYWFLGLFYVLVFSGTQGLIILCQFLSIPFYALPLLCLASSFFLKGGLQRAPKFRKRLLTLPDFYLFSALWFSLVWAGVLMNQTVFSAQYNFLEAFVWCWFAAILFPVLAGIRERFELIDMPAAVSPAAVFLTACGFILLSFSFF